MSAIGKIRMLPGHLACDLVSVGLPRLAPWAPPSSLVLKQFSALTTDVNLTSHPAHLTKLLNDLKKIPFQFPYNIVHCWVTRTHALLPHTLADQGLTRSWCNGRSDRSPRH